MRLGLIWLTRRGEISSRLCLAEVETRRYKPASQVGAWLSPVEHCVRDPGVAGSNPAAPTNNFNGLSTPHVLGPSKRPKNESPLLGWLPRADQSTTGSMWSVRKWIGAFHLRPLDKFGSVLPLRLCRNV